MHTNVILTNKRRAHAQSNYTNTKLKAGFRRLLRHPARKRSGPILHPRTHTGDKIPVAKTGPKRSKLQKNTFSVCKHLTLNQSFLYAPGQLILAIPPRVGKMSTGDDYGHRQGRNGEFCVTVGPVTRTADILTQSRYLADLGCMLA